MSFIKKEFSGSPKKLLTRKEAAEMLGASCGTLAIWASCKRYPLSYIKVGRLMKYDYEDVLKFLELRKKGGSFEGNV